MSNPPNINGYVNLHKPIGITSMEAVRRIKRHLPKKTKVGHAGTLDPLAEGVLGLSFAFALPAAPDAVHVHRPDVHRIAGVGA